MAVLASYTFAGTVLTAATVGAGVSASALKGNGTAGKVAAQTIGSYPDQPVLVALPSGGPAFGHRQLIDSFEVTVTPQDGGSVTLGALTFKAARGGSSTARGFEVTSSVDGYGASLLSVSSVPTQRSTFTSYSVDLASLGAITSPVTLRWYYVTGSSTASLDFDDFVVNGTVTPASVDYYLSHQFSGTTGAVFTSDTAYAHIAGTKPTVVRESFAKGLRFTGSGQGIIEHVYDPAPGAGLIVHDRVYLLGAAVTATSEVWQGRVGTARGPAIAFTSDNKLRLLKLTGTTGVSAQTSTTSLPVGVPFRVAVTTNGVNLTAKLYLTDQTTTVAETLTSTTSDNVALTAVREGVITSTGLGAGTSLKLFYPQDSRTVTPGPRTYALPTEPPRALVAQPTAVEPWQRGVELVGTPAQESNPIASTAWVADMGNPATLDAGTGSTRTFSAPGSLDAQSLSFTYTVTDTQGLTGSASVLVPVLPATFGVWDGTVFQPLDVRTFGPDYQGPPPAETEALTVANFQASTPVSTGRVFTFQTDAGVPVTVVVEVAAGTGAFSTFAVQTATGSHTVDVTGRAPSTAQLTKLTLSAEGYATTVLTAALGGVFAALNYTTAAAPVQGSAPKLTWAPPTLVDPVVWNISETTREINLPSDRDLFVVPPNRVLDVRGGFSVYGCRNIVWLGGEYRYDTPWYLPEFQTDGVRRQAAGTNRWLDIASRAGTAPRTIHLEGMKVHGSELFEGINWKANRDSRVTFRQQNIWVGKIRAFVPNPVNGGTHDGGDWWQPIEGPYIDQIDRLQLTDLEYQGLFLQPTQFGPEDANGVSTQEFGVWQYKNMQLTGGDTPKQLLAMNGSLPPAADRVLTNVWVQPNTAQGQTAAQAVKGTWINLNIGTAPTPMVDPTKVGLGYVSPGYL